MGTGKAPGKAGSGRQDLWNGYTCFLNNLWMNCKGYMDELCRIHGWLARSWMVFGLTACRWFADGLFGKEYAGIMENPDKINYLTYAESIHDSWGFWMIDGTIHAGFVDAGFMDKLWITLGIHARLLLDSWLTFATLVDYLWISYTKNMEDVCRIPTEIEPTTSLGCGMVQWKSEDLHSKSSHFGTPTTIQYVE